VICEVSTDRMMGGIRGVVDGLNGGRINEGLLKIFLCCNMFWSEFERDILMSKVDKGCSTFSEILNENATNSNGA
jgi:hypothetical protein